MITSMKITGEAATVSAHLAKTQDNYFSQASGVEARVYGKQCPALGLQEGELISEAVFANLLSGPVISIDTPVCFNLDTTRAPNFSANCAPSRLDVITVGSRPAPRFIIQPVYMLLDGELIVLSEILT